MTADLQNSRHQLGRLVGVNKRENYYELHYATGEIARVYLIASGIFRYWLDPSQEFAETDDMLVKGIEPDPQCFARATAHATSDMFIITTGSCKLIFQQKTGSFSIFDESVHRPRMVQASALELSGKHSIEILKQGQNEYYYGGGVQNGHFSHKGEKITIKTDGITGADGVLAAVPFFWTNAGFAELRNTTATGHYDFGRQNSQLTILSHRTPVFDSYYIIGNSPQELLSSFYYLTGKPFMLPSYALSFGHLGNFLDGSWQEADGKGHEAVRFEDNRYYTRKTENSGHLPSLNGEKDYQFSARAMLDRYQRWGFPLSWIIPNYESQAAAKPDDFAAFAGYAQSRNCHPGFWSEKGQPLAHHSEFAAVDDPSSNLAAVNSNLAKENPKAKPLTLVRDSLLPHQSQAALAFGDVSGDWSSIKTQISTLLGAGLSGLPFIGAAAGGKHGQENAQVAVRDLEWKTFTPLFFAIDDQSPLSKTPFAFNNKVSRIMKAYLELREQLKPYLYALSRQAQDGLPLVRPLLMAFPHEQVGYGRDFADEFMLGDQLLVAPIVNGKSDNQGMSTRDRIYLPDKQTVWINLFTGDRLMGGRVYNQRKYPLWQLPVFVRGGSIFDLGSRRFVLYPQGDATISTYSDNDQSDYKHNSAQTVIRTHVADSKLRVIIEPTTGYYPNMAIKEQTFFYIYCDQHPDEIQLRAGDEEVVTLTEYGTPETLQRAKEGFYYDNKFCWPEGFKDLGATPRPALIIKLQERDIKQEKLEILVNNFRFANEQLVHQITDAALPLPGKVEVDRDKISAHSLTVKWAQRTPSVQIELNGLLYTGISGNIFTFTDLAANTGYRLRLRYEAGYKVSEWSDLLQVKTKRDPRDFIISNVKVTSSQESTSGHQLKNLLDRRMATDWQSTGKPSEDQPLTLTFSFPNQTELNKLIYVPRASSRDGRPLRMRVEISTDGENFTSYGTDYQFNSDCKNRVIGLRGVSTKAVRLSILETTGDYAAASGIDFYRPLK